MRFFQSLSIGRSVIVSIGLGPVIWILLFLVFRQIAVPSQEQVFEAIQSITIVCTAIFVGGQLLQSRERRQLDRLIAWKSALQEINALILDHPAVFVPVLYPTVVNEEEAKRLTATYASLHALEIIYLMRKEKEEEPDLHNFIKSYVSGEHFRSLWAQQAYRVAFTKEFQDELQKTFQELAAQERR